MPRISVGVRVRPDANPTDRRLDGFNFNVEAASLELSVSGTQHSFAFDQLFPDRASQQDVFEGSTSAILNGVLEGYNGCIFAYGQTGAGKTHTMSGSVNGSEENYGLCARAALHLFARTRSSTDTFAFRLSVLEIYNENLIDLLVDNNQPSVGPNAAPPAPKLNAIDTENGVIVPGMHILPIDNADEALNLLLEAQSNRAVAEHQLNRRSSRSHVIYTFYVTRTHVSTKPSRGEKADDPVVHQSKLHIVDLAGSERVNKTLSTGSVQKEANYINKSLSYLEQVVIALAQSNRDHIPFRQSKLTYLLKDSLGGNCNTFLIACIWPKKDHSWETLSTLRFAARMKTIETHPVRNRLVTKEQAPSRVMQQQIDALKKELAMRDFLCGRETSWLPELSKAQKMQTVRQCMRFATTPISSETTDNNETSAKNLPLNSISQYNLSLDLLKRALWEACGGDEETVKRNLTHALVAEELLSANKAMQLFGSGLKEAEVEIVDSASVVQIDQVEDQNIDQYPDSVSTPLPTAPMKSREEYLEEFTAGPGRELHDSFEQAKEALKNNKARQREIVNLLNEQKSIIDEVTAQLTSMSDDALLTEEAEFAKERLDAAKKSYRVAHHELQICKEQINETQSLKKRAMTAMLGAFNEYLSSLGVEVS